MQIGISSWTYSWACGVRGYNMPCKMMDAHALLERAKELGVDCVQFADNLPLANLRREELLALRSTAQNYGLQIELGIVGSRPGTLRSALKMADLLEAHLLRTLLHTPGDVPDFAEAAQRLHEVQADFASAGVTLAVENHDLYPSAWLKKLMENVNSPFIGICLDAVNNLAQGESFHDVMEHLANHTVNFHCKDFTIRRKPSMLGFDVVGAPAGSGLIDFEMALAHFSARPISWVVELWTPEQEDYRKTLALEEMWAKESVSFLKTLKSTLKLETASKASK